MSNARHLWDEIAPEYDRTRTFGGAAEEAIPRLAARILLERGVRRVLDLGCGTGRFALPFAEAGLVVTGADRSPEMLARLAAKPGGASVRVVRCDAAALPFRAAAFDAMFTSHVLHHLPSVEALAAEVARVLRPGGWLLDADTTHVARTATSLVIERVFRRLESGWRPWPTGERSRMRDIFDRLAAALGGGPAEVIPGPEWDVPRTLRGVLAEVRARRWSTIRVHPEERVLAAADAAERALVAEGHDLDAPRTDGEGVRFLVARTSASTGVLPN